MPQIFFDPIDSYSKHTSDTYYLNFSPQSSYYQKYQQDNYSFLFLLFYNSLLQYPTEREWKLFIQSSSDYEKLLFLENGIEYFINNHHISLFNYLHKTFIKDINEYFSNYTNQDAIFISDRDAVLFALKYNGLFLQYVNNDFKSDFEIVSTAINENGNAFVFSDNIFKNNRELILLAIENNGKILQYLNDSFRSDYEIVLNSVCLEGKDILFASDDLKSNMNIVIEAVSENGLAIEHVNNEFKSDMEIVSIALKQDGRALEFIDEILKSDKELVRIACSNNIDAYKFASDEIRNNLEFFKELDDIYRFNFELPF